MGESKFKVLLTGVAEGSDPIEVQKQLAPLFKVAQVEVERYLADLPHSVKRHLDQAAAEKFRAALENAGATCSIEPEEEVADELDMQLEMDVEEEHVPEVLKMTCPKCSAEQEKSERCVKCGISFASYYKQKEREEEDAPPPEKKDDFPKIQPIYIAPKKTKPIVWVLRVFVVLAIGFGVWWVNENIRERDENPLPNPDVEVSNLVPPFWKFNRTFKRSDKRLKDKWSRRFYIVDQDGDFSPLNAQYGRLFKYTSIAKTPQGAQTLVIVYVKETGDDPTDCTLDVMFVDMGNPARRDVVTAKSISAANHPPEGKTLLYIDVSGEPEEDNVAMNPAMLLKKLITRSILK